MTTSTTSNIITPAQVARCHRSLDANGLAYYEVQSERDDNTLYEVRYSKEHGFTCTCPAGANGFANCTQRGTCKHVRWSLEAARHYRINCARIEELMLAGLTRQEAREAVQHDVIVDGKPADVATLVRIFSAKEVYPSEQDIELQAQAFQSRPCSLLK